jgi:hypothetical protein
MAKFLLLNVALNARKITEHFSAQWSVHMFQHNMIHLKWYWLWLQGGVNYNFPLSICTYQTLMPHLYKGYSWAKLFLVEIIEFLAFCCYTYLRHMEHSPIMEVKIRYCMKCCTKSVSTKIYSAYVINVNLWPGKPPNFTPTEKKKTIW